MRFYKGVTYSFKSAVFPIGDYSYEILDVESPDGKSGFLLFGYDRERKIGAASRIIISRKVGGEWKDRIYKIPFVRENKRLVFDLPQYLKENGLRYKLYKRFSLYERCISDGCTPQIYCKNGNISWGSEWCVDYSEFWLSVYYAPHFGTKIGGKKVKWLRFASETNRTDTDAILDCFSKSMEQSQNLSYSEFGKILERIGLHKENHFFEIQFYDGSSVCGHEIDWDNNIRIYNGGDH